MPTVLSNGIRIAYDEFGDTRATPMLLIMGLGAQMILWHDDFCATLAGRGYRVIRFDNRDVGESSWMDDLGMPDVVSVFTAVATHQPVSAPYLLRDMAADAAGLLAALDIERAHVVGVSMGGMIAQTLALDAPARLRSLTSIMSSTGNPNLPQPRPEAMAVLLTPPPPDREGAIARGVEVFRTIGSPGFPFEEDEVRRLAALSYDRGFNPAGTARQLVAILASGSRAERLRSLRVPTLVIHGTDDPLVPLAAGQETANAIPNAALLAIEGMGHDMPRPVWPRMIDAICDLAARADA
ncbi:MAG TPA: alpha/beta hydrolase [Candidatus Dormibacteraeota bacterium]|nr:alpha/beta hydrolase [Candidatus Dormibacteraeota bacterium]